MKEKTFQENRFKLLSNIKPNFLLVYRESRKSNWADRAIYQTEYYNKEKLYNHREIFPNEVVIEYDNKTKCINELYTKIITKRLKKNKILYDLWYSGNKSIHIHTFWDIPEVKYLSLLKKAIMFELTDGLQHPDLRLSSDGHLIRAEYGLHESTNKNKSPMKHNSRLLVFNKITKEIWDRYNILTSELLHRKVTTTSSNIKEHPAFKIIFNPESFKEVDDGRERAMFFLLQVLKKDYTTPNDLFVFIYEWYKYSGGYKLSKDEIKRKVKYHWNKDYNLGVNYLENLVKELSITL
jgi:hypothetical protein